jgi:hypothetical protein
MKRLVMAAFVLVLAAPLCVARAADKPNPTGTWKWTVEINGNKRDATLKLKLEDSKLTGAMVGRNGTDTAIDDGKFKDGEVSFSVTRERNGKKMTSKYSGKVDGDTLKLKIESEDPDGKPQTREVEAKRSKD